jgi:hypothetical protein
MDSSYPRLGGQTNRCPEPHGTLAAINTRSYLVMLLTSLVGIMRVGAEAVVESRNVV